eukprot:XP_001187034.2 PREDICTED: WSC domain-containing protein 1 [Strongylocentrotus purpuratus]
MGCVWYRRAPLFRMLLCGITTFCIIYIGGDALRRVQHLRDRPRRRIETDLIITRNTTKKATETGAGLVFCNDTRLMPEGTFPPIALASFPGSGNSWVRHLIKTSTGYATGSVYASEILRRRGFPGGEGNLEGRALTIKTHVFQKNMVGAILLLRNPYRAMVAEFNRREAGQTGHAPEKEFKTEKWHPYVEEEARNWIKLYRAFISECHHPGNTCKSTLIVYYEQLQLHLKDELRRILEYLHITIDEERLACAVANAEGTYHRPKRNQTLDPFSKKDRKLVDKSLRLYHDLIVREGLEKPPLSFSSYPSDL